VLEVGVLKPFDGPIFRQRLDRLHGVPFGFHASTHSFHTLAAAISSFCGRFSPSGGRSDRAAGFAVQAGAGPVIAGRAHWQAS